MIDLRLPGGDGSAIKLDLPSARLARFARRSGEEAPEFGARDHLEAHVEQCRRGPFAVVHLEAPCGEMAIEDGEAELGRVALLRELGFGEEDIAERNTVAAAHESAIRLP